MPLLDIIFYAAIFAYVVFRAREMGENKKSLDGLDKTANLTETQIRWRQMRMDQETAKTLTTAGVKAQGLDEYKQNILDSANYIKDNIRRFNIFSWFTEAVDPRLSKKYITACIIGVAIHGGFFLLSHDITTLFMSYLVYVLYIDVRIYFDKLLHEVTTWNPEYDKKFGGILYPND